MGEVENTKMSSLVEFKENEKVNRLGKLLTNYQSVLISFSGGVDSSFLVKACLDFLGTQAVLAVTAKSETYPDHELKEAREFARKLGVRWRSITSSEISNPEFRANPPDRCYYCKKELLTELKRIAKREGLNQVVEGTHQEDSRGHRPGLRAVKELGVKSPLKEAGFTKKDIRMISRKVGLDSWNKPSFACLASRFPYQTRITPTKLKMVDKAEDVLRSLEIKQFRVRSHGEVARIEVLKGDFQNILEKRKRIISKFKDLGYNYVCLDLEGYRTGSMDEVL